MFEHITPHAPGAIMTFMQRMAECVTHAPAGLTDREKTIFAAGFAHGFAQMVDAIEDCEAIAKDDDHAAEIASVQRLREQLAASGTTIGDRVFVPCDNAKRTLRALVLDAQAACSEFAAALKPNAGG